MVEACYLNELVFRVWIWRDSSGSWIEFAYLKEICLFQAVYRGEFGIGSG